MLYNIIFSYINNICGMIVNRLIFICLVFKPILFQTLNLQEDRYDTARPWPEDDLSKK